MGKIATIEGSTNNQYYKIYLDVYETENASSNTSDVTVKFNMKRTSGGSYAYNGGTYSGTITINGTARSFSGTLPYPSAYAEGQSREYGSATVTGIAHDNNGAKTIGVSASYSADFSPSSASASGNVALKTYTIGSPTITISTPTKTQASTRGGSDGSVKMSVSTTAGTNCSVSTYSVTMNGTTKTKESAPTFTGLKNNTTYSYSGSITNNRSKTGSTSGSCYITPYGPNLSDISVSPSRTSATFSYTDYYDTNRKYSSIKIEYGTSSSSLTSSSTSTTLSSLSPNTKYYYKMVLTDQNNGGPYTSALSSEGFTGNFTTTCNKPSALSLRYTREVNSIRVILSATGDTNAPITKYLVYFRKKGDSSYTEYDIGTSTSKTFTDLLEDTDYEVYFKATNAGGTTNSSTTTVSTKINPITLSDLTVTNITPFTCDVSITAQGLSGRTKYYYFSSDNGATWSDGQTNPYYTITNLKEETTYTIKVMARIFASSSGGGMEDSYSSSVVITTPADQAKIRIKDNNTWLKGKGYYKKDGEWVKIKKIYIKKDGQWKIGHND